MNKILAKSLCLAFALAALANAGCDAPKVAVPAVAPQASPPAAIRVILISAAASTKEAVAQLAKSFEANSGGEVRINAGPSNALATQIVAGAPADLFLSANRQWAQEVEKSGQSVESLALLTNKLVLVVPKGNPAGVNEPADLLKGEVKRVALAGESVPAGMYAQQALMHLKLYDQLVQEEKIARGQDVRSTLSYVERGETEAGIVYSTDLRAAKDVETVYEFDPQTHDEIAYILVLLRRADDNPAALEFYRFLASAEAENTWKRFGFERIPTAEK